MPNYRYNGVELPDINEVWTDKVTYPYALITRLVRDDGSTYVVLNLISRYNYIDYGGSGDQGYPFQVLDGVGYFLEDNAWQHAHDPKQYSMPRSIMVWANFDVIDSDGSVTLAASDPVPVPDDPDPDGYRGRDTITLGSGMIYVAEYDGGALPDVDTLCGEENRLGYIKSGAALTYTEETVEEKDDLHRVCKIITTNESATLKCGLISWDLFTLYQLLDRCKVTEEGGRRTIKIGGPGNAKGKTYVVCFHHEDKKDGDLWVVLVGRNTAGFTIAYSMEAGALIEPEFKALPHDEDGTLIKLIEGRPGGGAA